MGPKNSSNHKLLKFFRSLACVAFLALACCAGGMSGGGHDGPMGGVGQVGGENNATGFGVGEAAGDDNPAWTNSDGLFQGGQANAGLSGSQRNYAAPGGDAGFPDPAKDLSLEYRVMFRKFEGICSEGGKKIHMKVHGYLVPKKKKLGARVFRIVDDGTTYVNVKTPHDPIDFMGGDVYPFTFEITSVVKDIFSLPWHVFFFVKEDPEPTIFNEELPCEGDLCTAVQYELAWWTAMAKTENLDPKDLPACPTSPTQAQPLIEKSEDAAKNILHLQP